MNTISNNPIAQHAVQYGAMFPITAYIAKNSISQYLPNPLTYIAGFFSEKTVSDVTAPALSSFTWNPLESSNLSTLVVASILGFATGATFQLLKSKSAFMGRNPVATMVVSYSIAHIATMLIPFTDSSVVTDVAFNVLVMGAILTGASRVTKTYKHIIQPALKYCDPTHLIFSKDLKSSTPSESLRESSSTASLGASKKSPKGKSRDSGDLDSVSDQNRSTSPFGKITSRERSELLDLTGVGRNKKADTRGSDSDIGSTKLRQRPKPSRHTDRKHSPDSVRRDGHTSPRKFKSFTRRRASSSSDHGDLVERGRAMEKTAHKRKFVGDIIMVNKFVSAETTHELCQSTSVGCEPQKYTREETKAKFNHIMITIKRWQFPKKDHLKTKGSN